MTESSPIPDTDYQSLDESRDRSDGTSALAVDSGVTETVSDTYITPGKDIPFFVRSRCVVHHTIVDDSPISIRGETRNRNTNPRCKSRT